MRERVVFATGFCLFGAVAACSAIIGTRDLTLVAGDGGGGGGGSGGGDGAVNVTSDGSPGSTPDGSTTGNDGGVTTKDSGPVTCGAANLQTDPMNCGACGHDCLGGACDAGACQPVTIAAGQIGANGIAVDSTNVYWVNYVSGTIVKGSKDGTGAAVILATDYQGAPFDITLDATNVYWTDVGGYAGTGAGTVNTCPKSGGDGGVALTPADLNSVQGLTVDATHIYWMEAENGTVSVLNRADGGIGYLVAGLYGGYEVAEDDASVYFTQNYAVQKSPKGEPLLYGDPFDMMSDAAALTTYYSSGTVATYPWGVTLDATNVYWTVQGSGLVQYAPRSATGTVSPTTLAGTEVNPIMIVVDDANVYWTAGGPNSASPQDYAQYLQGYVATCPKTGCPASGPKKLATGLVGPYGIAVDDTAVYFTQNGNLPNSTTGSVSRVAK